MIRRSLRVAGLMLPLTLLALMVDMPIALATTKVISDCSNDNQLSSALIGGGTITFSCGTATIVLSSTKTISAPTTLDGGGLIKLSGNGARQLFIVNSGASLDLAHITLTKGNDTGNGGAIDNEGFLALDYSTITSSTSSASGGAIFSRGQMDITGSTLANNTAVSGGAIFATGSSANITVSGSTLHDNHSTGTHGTSNTAGDGGGAIYLAQNAQVYVYSSDIYQNTAAAEGGAIKATDSGTHLTVAAATTIHDDQATLKGGGVFNTATADLSNTTLTGNIGGSPNQLGDGGGIYNYGTLTLTSVTMSGNKAYYGGAISNAFATMTLTNVTLSGNGDANTNDTGATAYAGAIDNFNATADLTNVTIAGNAAFSDDGGIFNEHVSSTPPYPTVLNLTNVLFVDNTPHNCGFGAAAPASSAGNVSTDGSCGFGGARDNATVALGPLETNGGYTLTQRLLRGSIAIDDGTNTGAPTADQRGVSRPQGSVVDVGAVEFVPCTGVPTTKPTLVGPASGAILNTTQPLLDWAGPDCATKFKVIVRRGTASGTIVFSKTVFPASQVKTSALSRSTTYVWQVKACDAAGCLAGDRWTFRIK